MASSRYRSYVIACSLDWKRVLSCQINGASTIESILKNNSNFRAGIYECYRSFFNIYHDQGEAFRRVLHLFMASLNNPFVRLECANFTPDEEKIITALWKACKSLKNPGGLDGRRIELTILAYIIKLLDDEDNHTDIPEVGTCSGKNCPFGKHQL